MKKEMTAEEKLQQEAYEKYKTEKTAFVSFSVTGSVTVPITYRDGDTEEDILDEAQYQFDELDLEAHLQDVEKNLLCIRSEDGDMLF